MKLDFVIIGAQKSASTYLQALIADHPDIYMPKGETPYFQDPDFNETILEDYLDLEAANYAKCIGIKRPSYIGIDNIPERIFNHNSNCMIIAVLRNPLDRFVSNFFHNISYCFAPNIDINLAIPKIINKDKSLLENYPRVSEIIENGMYGKYLSKYLNFFSKKNLLVFTQDEVIKNPNKVANKVYESLNISKGHKPNQNILSSRPQAVDYRKRSLSFKRRISKILYTYNAENTRLYQRKDLKVVQKLSKVFISIIKYLLDISGLFGPNKKPKITQENKKLLYSVYEKDIYFLESLLNLNLSSWKL